MLDAAFERESRQAGAVQSRLQQSRRRVIADRALKDQDVVRRGRQIGMLRRSRMSLTILSGLALVRRFQRPFLVDVSCVHVIPLWVLTRELPRRFAQCRTTSDRPNAFSNRLSRSLASHDGSSGTDSVTCLRPISQATAMRPSGRTPGFDLVGQRQDDRGAIQQSELARVRRRARAAARRHGDRRRAARSPDISASS